MDIKVLEATVISVVPFPIKEAKPGMIPPEFYIPAAEEGSISTLGVGLCQCYIYLDADRGSIPFTEFAGTVAKSIVNDYCNAQLEYRGDHCKPGLFWVPKKVTKEQALKEYASEIAQARRAQREWFIRLVRNADDSWNRVKKHSEISDIQRLACKLLNVKRDWLIEYEAIDIPAELAKA